MTRIRTIFLTVATMMVFATSVLAQTGTAPAGAYSNHSGSFLTGAIAVGIAAFGCGLGDGRAIAAACEGAARNPAAGGRIFTMLILGLALIETLVIFTFAAAFLAL
jgi:F-type H+-transporting ATPase subunit c